MPLVLGVASLAAATRVEVRDADSGRLVARGSAPVASPHPQAWWDALVEAVAAAEVAVDVAAMAVAAQRQALVLLDGAGTALGPASLRTDPRAAGTAAELASALGAARLAAATGHVPGADTPLARLVWRLATERELGPRVAAVLSAADQLVARLTGRFVTDRSGAAATGWWDPSGGRWRTDLLQRVVRAIPGDRWPELLPTVLRPAEVADTVSAAVHDLVRLRRRPLVAAGTSDVAAAALAAGAGLGDVAVLLDDDDPVAALVASAPVADASGRVVSLADACGRHLPAVGLAPVGRALATAARLLGTDPQGLARLAVAAHDAGLAAAAGTGLVVVPGRPASCGPRPPARPGIAVGLDDDTSPGAFAAAALLGAAAEVADAVDAVCDTADDGHTGHLVLAGAAGRAPGLAAAVAELTGRAVAVRSSDPATGACVQAAAALHGAAPQDVAATWGLADGDPVEPAGRLDVEAVRDAYLTARDRATAV